MGPLFNARTKGRFDCKTGHVPPYLPTSRIHQTNKARIGRASGAFAAVQVRKRDRSTGSLVIEFATLLEPHRSRMYRPCERKHAGGVINEGNA